MKLLDSNVLIASLVDTHPHNEPSTRLLLDSDPATIVFAAHTLAETWSILTRRNMPFRLSGAEAWTQLEAVTSRFAVVALTATQSLDAIRRFSALGTGPRLYDYLIGATGEAHGADTIVTWNTRDFDGLFPALRIITPEGLVPTPP